ncbi:MAG: phytanoyl-CoA dioxygenase family protein [Pyrinomonadaceae bacterium]|nr:phytanoyl-CoA dioxygenase family protein [Pyrinomonadaceae bacterium]
MQWFEVESEGFCLLENVIDEQIMSDLLEDLSNFPSNQHKKGVYGVRNLLNLSPKVRKFAESKTVRKIAENLLGANAKVVRAIYFDKIPNANWKVPWHQDLTVSVAEKIETKDFTAWSIKDKINHVQPPIELLENMVTLRFHLDDADETNGALKVLPKTHKFGRLSATEIQNLKSKQTVCLCKAKKGDCLLMKPLLLHSSSAGTKPKNRRIIHLEFSADELPNGLDWYGT